MTYRNKPLARVLPLALAIALAACAQGPLGDTAPEFQNSFSRRARLPLGLAEGLRRGAEHSPSRALLMPALRLFPALAPLFARLTRIGS